MKTILGIDCKAYRNTGTNASPTWNEVPNVSDPALALESSEANVTTREGGGWELTKEAIKKASFEWKMIADSDDVDWVAFRDAWLNKTAVEMLILDGPVGTAGSQGLRAPMAVLKFSRGEENEGVAMTEVSVKPTRSPDAAGAAIVPSWYTAV
jgi:hypothetical protein